MEPTATISSPSSLTHIGIGVPQKRFLETAQSFAPSSLIHAKGTNQNTKRPLYWRAQLWESDKSIYLVLCSSCSLFLRPKVFNTASVSVSIPTQTKLTNVLTRNEPAIFFDQYHQPGTKNQTTERAELRYGYKSRGIHNEASKKPSETQVSLEVSTRVKQKFRSSLKKRVIITGPFWHILLKLMNTNSSKKCFGNILNPATDPSFLKKRNHVDVATAGIPTNFAFLLEEFFVTTAVRR